MRNTDLVSADKLSKACAIVVEAYKTDQDFHDAFVASICSACREACAMTDFTETTEKLAEYISDRLMDVSSKSVNGNVLAMHDKINNPLHYNHGTIEAIDVIEDWGLDFSLGSAVKYICRAGHKDGESDVQDLSKALWYVQREIARIKKGLCEL